MFSATSERQAVLRVPSPVESRSSNGYRKIALPACNQHLARPLARSSKRARQGGTDEGWNGFRDYRERRRPRNKPT